MNENCLNNQPVVMMKVPRYEYARLVRDSEQLAIVVKLTMKLDSYDLNQMLHILFDKPVTEDE